MMRYQSDWPEAGLAGPTVPVAERAPGPPRPGEWSYGQAEAGSGIRARLCANPSAFESELYRIPCRDIRLEAYHPEDAAADFASSALTFCLEEAIPALLSDYRGSPTYLCAKVVPDEPLHDALMASGFDVVEHRRLYRCRIGDLLPGRDSDRPDGIAFVPLGAVSPELHGSCRRQMLDLCVESFREGQSRHFRDDILRRRASGIDYMRAVMELNFRNIPDDSFLLALEEHTGRVVGFSVVGVKPALAEETYTQLLSAVHPAYRGRGVYRGLTRLLADTFPKDAFLLNVTHAASEAMQRAYRDSGRVHLADTLVVRRLPDAVPPGP